MQYPARYTVEYLKRKCIIDGCWTWQGKTCNGYATVAYEIPDGRKYVRVHRMMYELSVGEIGSGLVIDHLCDNTRCINPSHLEPKTIFENAARGGHQSAINKLKTSCIRGHTFDAENTYTAPNGTRHCRACKRMLNNYEGNNATRVHS